MFYKKKSDEDVPENWIEAESVQYDASKKEFTTMVDGLDKDAIYDTDFEVFNDEKREVAVKPFIDNGLRKFIK